MLCAGRDAVSARGKTKADANNLPLVISFQSFPCSRRAGTVNDVPVHLMYRNAIGLFI